MKKQKIKIKIELSALYIEILSRMHEVSAHTEFPCTLTMTNYLSALFNTLNSILSVTNLSTRKVHRNSKTSCIQVVLIASSLQS